MKVSNVLSTLFLTMVFCLTLVVQAQDSNVTKFIVHEDEVYPSKVAEYEAASKNFADAMVEYNPTDAAFLAVALEDYRYMFLSKIDNYAALDGNPMKSVVEAMGEDKFENMMSKFDGTFGTHKDYVINLSHDMSYKSDDIVMDGVNYRQLDYYHIEAGKWEEAKAIAKEWTELHTAKNAPHGYRIYYGGLGTEPMIMVVRWAGSAAQLHANLEENQAALGDVTDLSSRTMAITRKRETYGAQMRPDISYQPQAAVADN